MSENQKEIPQGYREKRLPGINASLLMPDTWFFMEAPTLEMPAYFLTRESIRRNGLFTTGVSLNTTPDFRRKTSRSAVDFARDFFQFTPIQPIGELETEEHGPLVISRQKFVMPKGQYTTVPTFHAELVTKYMPPTHFYNVVAGNRITDTSYIAMFETPSDKWGSDKAIAEIMMQSIRFDPAI